MTQEQKTELEYLIDLLREASKWNVDQGDDALRLEVDLRINNILNSVEVEDETELHGETEVSPVLTESDYKALEAAKVNEHLASPAKVEKTVNEWKAKRVRCQENGHPVWRPLCQCHKEKLFPDNPKAKKFRWVWDGPKDKQAQMDAMRAEHDKGE